MAKSKGRLEAEISDAIIKFQKDHTGRGPDQTKTYIIGDIVLIRLKGVLTPAEKQLAKSSDTFQGRSLIKQVRIKLLENAKMLLYAIIKDITHRDVLSLHSDISTAAGERVIIFTIDREVIFPKEAYS